MFWLGVVYLQRLTLKLLDGSPPTLLVADFFIFTKKYIAVLYPRVMFVMNSQPVVGVKRRDGQYRFLLSLIPLNA